MSDNQRVFRKVKNHLKKMMPTQPQGHVVTLAMMIARITCGKKAQRGPMSNEVPDGSKDDSVESDQKSRGLPIHKSHLSDPTRVARLLIAACLAYLWIIYLGVTAVQTGQAELIGRNDRLTSQRAFFVGCLVYLPLVAKH